MLSGFLLNKYIKNIQDFKLEKIFKYLSEFPANLLHSKLLYDEPDE